MAKATTSSAPLPMLAPMGHIGPQGEAPPSPTRGAKSTEKRGWCHTTPLVSAQMLPRFAKVPYRVEEAASEGVVRKVERSVGRLDDIRGVIEGVYQNDLHAKRIQSLANATLGVMTSASLAVGLIGQALARPAVRP